MSDFFNGIGTLAALGLFIGSSFWLGAAAQRLTAGGSFMKSYFLGNRGLGAWALALTATVQSGGTFMGFPSLVYSHGWVVALWIAGYMVVPITGFAVLGKRLAQLSRRTGAITVPDFFRERFGSPTLGVVASLFLLFYMSFMMVAQFKAGALVMKFAWPGQKGVAAGESTADYGVDANCFAAFERLKPPPVLLVELKALDGAEFDAKEKLLAAVKKLPGFGPNSDPDGAWAAKAADAAYRLDVGYYVGLAVFTITVVGYTVMGGFLAAVWTDLFQSVLMVLGILLLLPLAISAAGGMEQATLTAVAQKGPGIVFGPGFDPTGSGREFLPLSLAFSFFVVWVFSGVGSPAGMVRVMACRDAGTLRRSIVLLSSYNLFIYLPLIMICICGHTLFPNLAKSDEIIPRMALRTTADLPFGSFLAGLILAAPFGAVMSTVSTYLVVIASGLVRDVYQRFVRPNATEAELRRMSHLAMVGVGLAAVGANISPPKYLQAFVVFSGTGAAATFLAPALLGAYWRRATAAGMAAAMFAGAGVMLLLFGTGIYWSLAFGYDPGIGQGTSFRPWFLLGMEPVVWGLLASFAVGVGVSLATKPPDDALVAKLFDAPAPTAG
ncbi:MAG: sodium:solute symporter family transporter [Planctomycetia bacterium]